MECNPIPKDPASELLSGEDFSRLNETAPRLIRALAERAGTSVSNLRKMASEGRLTSAALLHGVSTEQLRNDVSANAHAAAESARQAAASTRLAEIDAKYARSGDLAGFLREVGAAELTLVDLADWLAAAAAEGVPKFAVGDMLAKEQPGEAIVPKACATRISGAAGGGCGGIHPGDLLVSKDVAAAHMAALQPEALNPSPDALALLAELIAEMRALRQDHARMAQLLSRWDGDGVPAFRGQ